MSFNTGEGEDMADFVAAQLPDDDDLFLGMTGVAAICRSINNNNNHHHNNDNNALPVAMDTGTTINKANGSTSKIRKVRRF